jgi:hypothetical protein
MRFSFLIGGLLVIRGVVVGFLVIWGFIALLVFGGFGTFMVDVVGFFLIFIS